MKVFYKTDKGIVRTNNEDSLLVIPPWEKIAISKDACLFIVADGMGGHNAGEVASSLAMAYSQKWFAEFDSSKDISVEHVKDLITNANEEVWEYSQKHPETVGMGTTFTSILFKGNKAIVGHIGDSRLYRFRNGQLTQLTNDHSLVGEQVKNGNLTPEQARVHPARNILSRVLGARQFITPDIFEIEVTVSDRFLLCSDGVYSMLPEDGIKKILLENPIENWAQNLIEEANKAGGKDNSTIIALEITEFPLKIPGKFSLSRIISVIKDFFRNNK